MDRITYAQLDRIEEKLDFLLSLEDGVEIDEVGRPYRTEEETGEKEKVKRKPQEE